MKNKLFLIAGTLFCASFIFSAITFAQDHTQWGLPEGAKARLGKGFITEIAYSPDGTRLAVASSIGIWIYDTATNEASNLFTGHTRWIVSLSFSPDGTTLASGSEDATIRLWDVATGRQFRTFEGHTDWVESMSFSPDGTLASWSEDGTVLLWELTSPKPQRRTADVNADGIVNILDLVAVANAFGAAHPDINGDGIVNVLDLVAVANAFE